MGVVSVSLPASQIAVADRLVDHYSFANRSELFRCLIRFCEMHRPDIHTMPFTQPYQSPSTDHPEEFVDALEKTGKYPKLFLMSIRRGLRKYSQV